MCNKKVHVNSLSAGYFCAVFDNASDTVDNLPKDLDVAFP